MNTNPFLSPTTHCISSAVIVLFMLLLSPMRGIAADVELSINFNDEENPPTTLEMFWNGSGVNRLTADYNSKVMRQNMLLIGSIPHQGSLYQRPHDLLDLVTSCTSLKSIPTQCDWSYLDSFLEVIVVSGQKLFFELMGNPSGLFDFDKFYGDSQQREAWKRLVEGLTLHLIDRYGLEEVRSWYFQTWNESYRKWARNKNIGDFRYERGWKNFLAYYEASWAGLMAADPELRFGGPAVRQLNNNPINKIEWINRLINSGSKLDYISYHHKKSGRTITDWASDESDLLDDINLPGIPSSDNPFLAFNEEADSEGGWWKNLNHRATSWYAAFMAKQVHEYLSRIINEKGLKFRLANDNAFLRVSNVNKLKEAIPAVPGDYKPSVGAWKQRTHFAHFGDDKQNFALIKKPAHNVMTMLSLLGDKQYATSPDETSDGLGAIATKWQENQVAILVYHYHEGFENPPSSKNVQLKLINLPFSEGKLVHYRLDQDHSDTYEEWRGMGSPSVPSDDQIQVLRNNQELRLFKTSPGFDVSQNSATLNFNLPSPGVSLILISKMPERTRPVQVTGLYGEAFRSLNDERDEVLIRWDSSSRFIRNYKVFFSDSESGPFSKINTVNLISTAYIHQLEGRLPVGGAYYRVSAVNYSGKTGGASDILHVTKIEEPPLPVMREAEDYTTLTGAWIQGSSADASEGTYMIVPEGTGSDREGTGLALDHYMEYSFNAPGDEKHYVWARGFGNGGGHDSVWVSVDDGPLERLDISLNAWGWKSLSGFSFTKDSMHNLKVHLREDNTYVDKIIISSDSEFVPTP